MTTLLNSRLQNIAIFIFKIKNKLLPVNILEIFPGATTAYKLRNNDFFIPRFNTVRYGKYSLKYFGPFLWSKLPQKTRVLQSLSSFKADIKRKTQQPSPMGTAADVQSLDNAINTMDLNF